MLILWSFNTYSHKKCEVQDLGCGDCWRANPQRGRTNHSNSPASGILSFSDGKLPSVVRKTIFSNWNLVSFEGRLLSNSDVVILRHADVTVFGEFASVRLFWSDGWIRKVADARRRFIKNDELNLRLALGTCTFWHVHFVQSCFRLAFTCFLRFCIWNFGFIVVLWSITEKLLQPNSEMFVFFFFSRPLPVWWSRISSWRSRPPLIACPRSTRCLLAEGVFGVFCLKLERTSTQHDAVFTATRLLFFIEKPRVSEVISV